ncbi:hypothetical protein [Tellurirhabdus bombi]|uniref:hypothetical protein n=1 Tax=Tellurirhabdus bombi TaxID=2907205 RepID=UPI001F2F4053|nr:hypothetical protein [Tellurirhabdus bombi]
MQLGFTIKWRGTNRPTNFVEKILGSQKIHTLRADKKNRWKPGNTIQFATGTRTIYYNQFHSGTCKATQAVALMLVEGMLLIEVDRRILADSERLAFIKNDGFDSEQAFNEWFIPLISENGGVYNCKLIHWTDFKY